MCLILMPPIQLTSEWLPYLYSHSILGGPHPGMAMEVKDVGAICPFHIALGSAAVFH